MTSETYQDTSLDRKNQKRPTRPKLLKLSDVSMPNRSRKKTKFKLKERSQSNVRERIYDDPAYTDDISHLAIPQRRNSGPEKVETLPLPHKRKSGHKDYSQYVKRYEATHPPRDGSSSSENMPSDTTYHKRGQSLERSHIIERSPKKREKRDRAAKQKRNLSLDNTLSNSLRRSLEKPETPLKTTSIERSRSRQKPFQRQNASEGWSSCLAATSDSSKATENEEVYSGKKEPTKMQIGKRFLRGEIGIKSFNYYLLKEGLKSSKKFMDKQKNSLTKSEAKKLAAKSEENIYEEIFFMDKNSETEEPAKFPECELCVQECTTENCEYCLEDYERSHLDFYSLDRNREGARGGLKSEKALREQTDRLTMSDYQAKGAHILQYQSYNPNNPGVYKIETTPVAFTSDYNPIHHLQVPSKTQHSQQQQHSQVQQQQQHALTQQHQQSQIHHRTSKGNQGANSGRINTKSSSSSDSLHHKYGKHKNSQDFYECPQQVSNYAVPHPTTYEQKIYKSDSRVSILSEYSIRSESSHRNFRCGEVSDSSLGDSMFSYSTQRRYFGSSESCRFGFECRRCSLDGEKCSFSDTCRYECRNCDCSSSYFSSDFDDVNNSRKSSTRLSSASQKSYEYYNDTVDVKQNKYAQDFIKHVNDVKRSIYQAELQRNSMSQSMNSYGTIPPPKQADVKKSISHYHEPQFQQQAPQHQQARRGSSPFKPSQGALVSFSSPNMKGANGNRDRKSFDNNHEKPSTGNSHTIKDSKASTKDLKVSGTPQDGDEDTSSAGKNIKNSEEKYTRIQATTTTTTATTLVSQQTMTTSTISQASDELSKQDRKDAVSREKKKQTGAIPKSTSSATPSQSSGRSHRSGKESGGNSSGGSCRSLGDYSASQKSGPSKNVSESSLQSKPSSSSQRDSEVQSTSTGQDETPTKAPKPICEKEPKIEAAVTQSPENPEQTTGTMKAEEVLPEASKGTNPDNPKSGKPTPAKRRISRDLNTGEVNKAPIKTAEVDDNKQKTEADMAKDVTTDTVPTIPKETERKVTETKNVRKKKEPKDETKFLKPAQPQPQPGATLSPKGTSKALTEWSDDDVFEEEDDDVFIDPEKEKLRKKKPIARKRVLATPNTPATPKTPETTISASAEENKRKEESIFARSEKPELATAPRKTESDSQKETTPEAAASGSVIAEQKPKLVEATTVASSEIPDSKTAAAPETETKQIPDADVTKGKEASFAETSKPQTAAPPTTTCVETTSTTTPSVSATKRLTKHSLTSIGDGAVGAKAHTIPRSTTASVKAHSKEKSRSSADSSMKTKHQLVGSIESVHQPHHRPKSKLRRSVRNEMREGERGESRSTTAPKVTAASTTSGPDVRLENVVTLTTCAAAATKEQPKPSGVSPDSNIYAIPCITSSSSSNIVAATTIATTAATPAYATPSTRATAVGVGSASASASAGGTSAEEISCKSDVAGVTINRDQTPVKPKRHYREEGTGIDTSEATSTDESRLTKESTRSSNEVSLDDKIDISDLPLPEIPPKKRRSKTNSRLGHHSSLTSGQRDVLRETFLEQQRLIAQRHHESLDSGVDSEKRKMHYHNLGHVSAVTATSTNNQGKPTYLFGENRVAPSKKGGNTDEIYLNKSGWVQVNPKRINDENSATLPNRKSTSMRLEGQNGAHKNAIRVIQVDKSAGAGNMGPGTVVSSRDNKPIYAVPRVPNSKIEDLISRSEMRRGGSTTKVYMRPGYKIVDPQIASILNERPGFLPVKTFMDIDSPPPVTPILSPPPAFQDTKAKNRCNLNNNNVSVQINVASMIKNDPKVGPSKGMVFSRSFEYDRKHPADYAETFSKSFDSNLSEQRPQPPQSRDRSPNFGALTGCSPNYLSKKDSQNSSSSLHVGSGHSSGSGKSRDSSPKYQQIGTAYIQHPPPSTIEKPVYSTPRKLEKYGKSSLDRNGRSRRAQFTRVHPTTSPGNSRFRSFDIGVSQRLNSCDSGARSDLSNDEIDDDDDMSNQFLTTNYQSQGSFGRSQGTNNTFIPKQRSITPERYDNTGSYQNSLRKQRSLTPESRSLTPEERRKKGSQVSLSSSHNSRSRTSTLERKQNDKSHSASRSSSSSSYSGREYDTLPTHRRSTTRNSKLNEEHRIRRSRSLQLSEKSPNRSSQSHKMVICLGAPQPGGPSNQPIYQQPVRTYPSTIRQSQKISDQSSSSRHSQRSSDIDKSRSFDFDYSYSSSAQNTNNPRVDFDKSRSFDEDYRDQSNKLRYMTEPGALRDNRLSLKLQRNAQLPRQTSPQNYGTRLCDHELTYDMLRRTYDRSPIMDFSREHDSPTSCMRNRESELNYLNERIYDQAILLCDQSPGDGSCIIVGRDNLTPESDHKSGHGSAEDRYRMSNDRVCDYIYRQPMKGQHQPQPQQRAIVDRSHQIMTGSAAPAIGSCTASSCDFWPHCGVSKLKTNKKQSVDHPNDQSYMGATSDDDDRDDRVDLHNDDVNSHDDNNNVDDNDDHTNVDVDNNFDIKQKKRFCGRVTASGSKIISVFSDHLRATTGQSKVGNAVLARPRSPYRKSYSLNDPPQSSSVYSKSNVIVIGDRGNLKTSPRGSKASLGTSSVVYLGEREMPITREREMPTSPTTIRLQHANSTGSRKTSEGKLQDKFFPSLFSAADYHASTTNIPSGKQSRSNSLRARQATPVKKYKELRRPRSLSLPNILLQVQYSPSDANEHDPFSTNLAQQMRAVSSPSLCESPLDNLKPKYEICQDTDLVPCEHTTPQQNYVGVLQKFKKTFTQFNKSKQVHQQPVANQSKMDATPVQQSSECDPTKHRFGTLIWRSSKERRKAKHNRRDKCNSGDSGIQIELDNDEPTIITHDGGGGGGGYGLGIESLENITPSPSSVRIRRANSAKAGNSMTSCSSVKAKALKKVENSDSKIVSTPIPTRSLSQPSGLDRMARGGGDVDESDTDSVSSHPDLHEVASRPIYAEVLFSFTPGGPQELALEKGTLIEIIRKDTGPWWLGRVKHEAALEKVLEPQQGWFPKDFVRILPSPFEADHHSAPSTAVATATTTPTLPAIRHCPNIIDCTNALKNATCDSRLIGTSGSLSKSLLSSPSQQHCAQSSETLRNNVIKELLETEINYVKLLSSLCLGYLKELQKRIDIFSTESLNLIFSNIESIWRFQQTFLDALRKGVENGRIAQVFLEHQSGFMVYSTYCNSYPRALMELESYSNVKEANIVLENCRVAENLPELPLSAHLLAPIQRICRYPLHLAELVKHNPPRQAIVHIPDSSDSSGKLNDGLIDCKEAFEYALAAMKKVTEMVNEGKRHSENLNRFQTSFENFQGPPLAFHSTRFFMQTDVTRGSPNLWNNTYTLFLFDHQLIYCKKDLLKRNHYIYKGRIFLDSCRISGSTLKNALRLYCEQTNKSFEFCFRSASRKIRFLSTLAAERQFCGSSIFISEYAGDEDEYLSDREYHSDYDTPTNTLERGSENNFNNLNVNWKDDAGGAHESPHKQHKYSDTLPKKSRKVSKDGYEHNTGSLGRWKNVNWFRKAKSTNTTPTQSPTHHSVTIFNSDSSSQSSPALGYKATKAKVKDPTAPPS